MHRHHHRHQGIYVSERKQTFHRENGLQVSLLHHNQHALPAPFSEYCATPWGVCGILQKRC